MSFDTNTEPPIAKIVMGCVPDITKHTLAVILTHWIDEGVAVYERVSQDGRRAEAVENGTWYIKDHEGQSVLSVEFPDSSEIAPSLLNLLMADVVKRGWADAFHRTDGWPSWPRRR